MSDAESARALRRIALAALGWLVLGEWLVPEAIAWLHRAEVSSWWPPLARAVARGQQRHELAYYVASWREDGRWALGALLAYQAFALATRAPRFAARFVPPATAFSLGAIRALVASVLLASACWEHLPSSALLPRGLIHGEGPVLDLLYALPIGFDRFVASESALAVWQGATIALLACAALGYHTRLSVPLAAASYLVFAGILRQYAWFYHTGLVPLYLLFALALTPCGEACSLDRWLRTRRGAAVAPAHEASLRYGWPRFFVWTALAFPYVAAGVSKLRRGGFDWPHADNLKSILLIDTLNPMQFDFGVTLQLVQAPDLLFWGIGVATLVGEIGYASVLFSRRARLVLPLVTLAMHLGIWLLQNVLFFDLMLLQAILIDWSALARRLGLRVATSTLAGAGEATLAIDWPRRLRALAGVLIACWALRIEAYPFTAMQMYSKPNLTRTIEWYALVAHTESGGTLRAPIERALPALRDARHRRALRQSFGGDSAKRALAESLWAVFLREHNARAAPGERLVAVEAQQWRWSYARNPESASHGELAARYVVRAAR